MHSLYVSKHLQKSKSCKDYYSESGLLKKIKELKEDKQKIVKFNQKQEGGLDYICVCCCTVRFKRSVQEFTDFLRDKILDNKPELSKYFDAKQERFKFDGKFWIHTNCATLLQQGKIPNISFANGLWNDDDKIDDEIPEEFKNATLVEKLAVKKKIPFIKVRELPSSRMKFMKDKVINVAISDSDLLKTALTLPRMGDTLGTVNVAVKRQMRSRTCFKGPELVRPKVINAMLKFLQAKHKSYKNFPIQFLDESSKYKFITLPLVGEDEPDENSLSLIQAYEKLVPPALEKLNLKVENITPQDANCFLSALLDQCRMDNEYENNDFTVEQMRYDICLEIFKDENKDLHHVLYYGPDLLEAEDWKDLMTQINEDTLYCDLPFVQLASNFLRRQII